MSLFPEVAGWDVVNGLVEYYGLDGAIIAWQNPVHFRRGMQDSN